MPVAAASTSESPTSYTNRPRKSPIAGDAGRARSRKNPTVSTARTSPSELSSISVTRTGSRTSICCKTGSTMATLLQPSTAPTSSADVQETSSVRHTTSITSPAVNP